MEFKDQLNALIFFHLEEHTSGRHLLQSLKEDCFASEHIAPEKGIAKSLFEAMSERGLEQFLYALKNCQQAAAVLPQKYPELGQLVSIDGSLIHAVFSMKNGQITVEEQRRRKHISVLISIEGSRGKYSLPPGKGGERPFVSNILGSG